MRRLATFVLLGMCVSLALGAWPAAGEQARAQAPSLSVTVTHDALDDEAQYGSTVTFTYTVWNTGDTTVTALSVADSWAGALVEAGELAPGESVVFKRDLVMEGALGGAGSCSAAGLVSGETVTGSGSYFIDIYMADYFADFAVAKRLVSGQAVAGGTLKYRVTITNVYKSPVDGHAKSIEVIDRFDATLASVVDAGDGKAGAGRLSWTIDAPEGDDAPVVLEYTLRLADDATGSLVNTVELINATDTEGANNRAVSRVAISAAFAADTSVSGGGGGAASASSAGSAAAGSRDTANVPAATAEVAEEPFLPYTGASLPLTLALSAGFAGIGVALRRVGG